MGKNDYLAKQRAMQQGFLDVGEQFGMQKMWDFLQLALRNPNVMKKDIFGRSRLEPIYEELKRLADEYSIAFTMDKEADYKQEQLDAQLREIWGDDLAPFCERYPELKKIDYGKSKKGWK